MRKGTTADPQVICVMTIPSNLIALKIRPSWLLAGCEIGWMIFTFAQAGAQSVHAMYGFRFCVALFEAAFAPAAIFLLGSWYSPPELAKRVTIWFISGIAGLSAPRVESLRRNVG